MSGGSIGDYGYWKLDYVIEDIEDVVSNNNLRDEYGYATEYSEETIKRIEEGLLAIKKARIFAQRIDWLVSGDDSEKSFHKRLEVELNES